MDCYSVSWKDREGTSHHQAFEASSATAAISLALEHIELLRLHPNLIYRVFKEDKSK